MYRIAIYHNLPSGGAKRTLQEQVSRLASRHSLDVYSLATADHIFADLRPFAKRHKVYQVKTYRMLNSPFGRINPIFRMLNVLLVEAIQKAIATEIEDQKYDVLLAHPCMFTNSPSLLKQVRSVKKLFYLHEPYRLLYESMPKRPYDPENSNYRGALNKIDPLPSIFRTYLRQVDQINIRQADQVIVNSQFIQKSVHQIYGIDARVSYHGVDNQFFKPTGSSKEPFLLSVGSLTPLKGFDFLIQSLGEIPASDRLPLVIASNFENPPEKEYLKNLGSETGVDVRFEGRISDERLVELYNRAMTTLYAPIREPFGLVPLESMACATPVLGVKEGGIPETIIEGVTGLLEPRDTGRYAEAIQYATSHPDEMKLMGYNSRLHVEKNWTWERAINTLEGHIHHMVQ